MATSLERRRHFVLVHGAGHGAWCWYKVAALLEAAGHVVTAVDLVAAGVNTEKRINEVTSLREYTRPLLDVVAALPEGEKAVIVGHSMGGVSIALAAEDFPEKIAVVVFATALLPPPETLASDSFKEALSLVLEEIRSDFRFTFDDGPEKPPTSLTFGHVTMSYLYKLCSPEDMKLGWLTVRPTRLFADDPSGSSRLTAERYGSVPRVYILCKGDDIVTEETQRGMVEKAKVDEVIEIDGAGHMVMLSKPKELLQTVIAISDKYA